MKPFQLPRWKFSSCCGHECGYDNAHEGSRARATRRDFIKGAAASIAGLSAVAALPVEAVAQGRTYPPPPPATSPVDGLIDFHVHTAPDVFTCPHRRRGGCALEGSRDGRGGAQEPHCSHCGSRVDRATARPRHEDLRRHHAQRLRRRYHR
ncbi:MAG: hypothetical protein DMD96_33925 [Candidatus Rokuibacteriota bacterium]|nr:MAG: hypothetical protein DMD96_33925 [Candidatus Rokubacteria bacterium]